MTDTPDGSAKVSAIFARMSGLLISGETLQTALNLVVSLAQETIDHSQGVGVTLIRDGRRAAAAASDPLIARADDLQYELDEGPRLSAYRDRRVYRIDDLRIEDRWPRWAAAAQEFGMLSSLNAPLAAVEQTFGAIEVCSGKPNSYDDHDAHLLERFAAHAAILLANVQSYEGARQVSEQLQQALLTRDLIGQAKGIVMAREGVDEQTAFDYLVGMSQRSNLKLREVARRITESATDRES